MSDMSTFDLGRIDYSCSIHHVCSKSSLQGNETCMVVQGNETFMVVQGNETFMKGTEWNPNKF